MGGIRQAFLMIEIELEQRFQVLKYVQVSLNQTFVQAKVCYPREVLFWVVIGAPWQGEYLEVKNDLDEVLL
jgi:hypothetical protein